MRYFRALLAGCTALFLLFPIHNALTHASEAREKKIETTHAPVVAIVWKQPAQCPEAMTASPNGKFIGVVGDNGSLKCLNSDGKLVWKDCLEGVDRLAVGPDGSAIAYTYLNPAKTEVYLISTDGQVRWHHNMDGAAWAATASPEAGCFAVGTGEKYCYIYRFSGRRQRYERWKLTGVPCSARFTQDGGSLLFGTWQESGVCAYSVEGSQRTLAEGRGDMLYTVDVSRDGGYALVMAKPNRSGPGATVQMKNASDLGDLWRKNIDGYSITSDVDASGSYVVVGYQRMMIHKDEEMKENRIALYDRSGNLLWEKGGVFGKWNLLQLLPSGQPLVYDESSLYVLDQKGNICLSKKLPGTVKKFLRDPSRERVILYCGNGELCAISIK